MKVLVTGAAGFIGFHVSQKLIARGDTVIGFDIVNDYYDVTLKEARLRLLDTKAAERGGNFTLVRADLADAAAVDATFAAHEFDRVVHLAAQAGVRNSIKNPKAYVQSNLVGFINVLEACRHHRVAHLTYASTSSVYGANTKMPFSEHHGVDHPLQLYAATKRANELMAHSYSHLFGLPTTGLRFFTVYGPWGRPDMAPIKFAKSILAGEPIDLFNQGNHTRDFTYVEDVAEAVIRASDDVARPDPNWDSDAPDPATSNAPFRIFNIGNSSPVKLSAYIEALETALGRKAITNPLPLQPGDVPDTYADTTEFERSVGFRPTTPIGEGVRKFAEWYTDYYAAAGVVR